MDPTPRRRSLVILGVLLLSGCATAKIPIQQEERARLKDQPVILTVQYDPARIQIERSSIAIVGALTGFRGGGLAADMAERNYSKQLTEEFRLEDLAITVRGKFLKAVTSELSLPVVQAATVQKSDDVRDLKAALGGGHVIDVKTQAWLITFYRSNWTRYRVVYRARARLVRLDDAKVRWQGVCSFRHVDPSSSPTFDEMMANRGVVLKTRLIEAASACADQLIAQFLGATGGSSGRGSWRS